ncbi:MAG: DUF805 domain-containing protein [Streptococcus salivarius]|uniref:DUF805 domain-containing protein n=1 Tax=unclassified Streptococcus TaxID=2608887 RepID=UPI0008A92F37|nr:MULTISPECIES: DUF805 domain-containing protein [unclassified Streptococcus]MBS6253182.1 DUF805 domain-containing protein [Streptococcus sp.]MDU5766008.1 DUF805 domain-containing protein [Streptococcus salivarius]OHQ22874.1 hypothetical protein HMPREF2637_04380 [Streptococcus sp. HMSC065H07]
MIEAYKKFWKGYVDFTGRSTPSDLWSAYLAHLLIVFAGYLLLAVFERMAAETGSSDLFTIGVILLLIFFAYGVAAVLPGIALTVRRLRDAGYNWPYIFIPLIPFVGIFIFIFLLCQPTKVEVPLNNVDNLQQ